jgi:hypothetical protein
MCEYKRKRTKHDSLMFCALTLADWSSRGQNNRHATQGNNEPVQHAQDDCGGGDDQEDDCIASAPEDDYDRAKVRRIVMYIVLIPSVVSVCLWFVGTYATKDYLPATLDVHLWRNFSMHVKQSVKAFDSKYPHNVLLVLLAVHAVQVLFCFPMMHVTKIMYGYFFGTLQGGWIACAWELFLVCLFVLVATQNIPSRPPATDLAGFLQYVGSLRSRRLLVPFLVALHMSSIPLVTSTCLVLFQVVGRCEFLTSHALATCLTTFKDTWLGNFLSSSDGNAGNIAIAATLLSLSALLPTVITVLLMGLVSAASISKPVVNKSFARL